MAESKATVKPAEDKVSVSVRPPNFQVAEFRIVGTSPLVVHRFSVKVREEMRSQMEAGKAGKSTRKRDPINVSERVREARYIHADGWDGVHASSFRNAMIDACRLVGAKMTLAKLSVFVIQDGWDKDEFWIPLVRIITDTPVYEFVAPARTETGVTMLAMRPMYRDWRMNVRVRWDADQFKLSDVTNLMLRVGQQVGIGEGRWNSKNSAGIGWGCFNIEGTETP